MKTTISYTDFNKSTPSQTQTNFSSSSREKNNKEVLNTRQNSKPKAATPTHAEKSNPLEGYITKVKQGRTRSTL